MWDHHHTGGHPHMGCHPHIHVQRPLTLHTGVHHMGTNHLAKTLTKIRIGANEGDTNDSAARSTQ